MELNEQEREVILAYADHNMVATDTARSIYRHRNAVFYYLGTVYKKTGLNPKNFYDLIKLVDMVKEKGNE